jgi:hypothetical protein
VTTNLFARRVAVFLALLVRKAKEDHKAQRAQLVRSVLKDRKGYKVK